MAKPKLQDLSKSQLEQKAKSLKGFIGIFVPIILALFYFVIRDYLNGEELDFATLTIAICALGGPATLYPELKEVQKELETRS